MNFNALALVEQSQDALAPRLLEHLLIFLNQQDEQEAMVLSLGNNNV